MPNILQDNAQNKDDYMEKNEVHIMSHEVLELSTDLVPTTSANESKEEEPCTIATTTVIIHHLESRMTQNQEGENDEIMHMFAASGVYIQMSPWSPPFMMMGRQGCAAPLQITLSPG
jgi:acyl-CoA reductase-like NAD-dependent aldehyde dehydrogenase